MIRFIRLPEVLSRVGVSWVTLLRWEREGAFPLRRRLGRNSVGWIEREVDEWCDGRPELSPHRETSDV